MPDLREAVARELRHTKEQSFLNSLHHYAQADAVLAVVKAALLSDEAVERWMPDSNHPSDPGFAASPDFYCGYGQGVGDALDALVAAWASMTERGE